MSGEGLSLHNAMLKGPLTLVGLETTKTCLPDDIVPVDSDINANCETISGGYGYAHDPLTVDQW